MIRLGLFCFVLYLETCYVASTFNSKHEYEYQREADVLLRLYSVPTTWANAGMRCTLEGVPLASIPLGWAPGEPDNASGAEDCVAMTGAGALEDVSCEIELPYFCSRKHKCGGRDNGYEWEPRTASCYKFHRDAIPWLQAMATCHAEGGHLAIINSDVESTVLKDLFGKNPSSIITADNPDCASVGFWEYNNNSFATLYGDSLEAAGFNKWSPGEPNHCWGNEYCGSINRDGLLNDVVCASRTYPFICERTPSESD